ncbi:MAG: saccharopine dehydrogenase [Kribbellaceae bacterium]|nr:saccharopine dehydrogenase [Kribbellaceae bacterium]
MSEKPVVVYGASGYTGRLVCEYLRHYHVPFVAAGRSEDKLKASMDANVPGIETADYEIAAVDHDVAALTDLFKGSSVVLNTVGPFSELGPAAVEAALAAGAHYTDTTGEQDWLITCDEKYGAKFAEAGLLLAPGIAQMYTTGEIAAQLCLEEPGLDTLDIAVFWGGSPTIASTRTILVNAATSKAHYLDQNVYVEFPEQGLVPLVVPGQHELALSLPWGGTSHPVWFKRDPRVANCKAQGGVFNAALMNGVPQIVAAALEATKDMAPEERNAALTETARQVMNQMPPRENPRVNKSLDSVHASGPLGRAHCVIHGNSNYQQTGLLQAYAAYSLLQTPPKRVGFASGCQAFGHRELLGVLRSFGLVSEPQLTVQR